MPPIPCTFFLARSLNLKVAKAKNCKGEGRTPLRGLRCPVLTQETQERTPTLFLLSSSSSLLPLKFILNRFPLITIMKGAKSKYGIQLGYLTTFALLFVPPPRQKSLTSSRGEEERQKKSHFLQRGGGGRSVRENEP